MFNQVVKWSVLLTIWRRYGAAIKWFPVVLLVLVLIYAVHRDFVEYVEVSKSGSYLALSFLLKWLAIVAVLIVYWWYIKSILSSSEQSSKPRFFSRVKKQTKRTINPEENLYGGAEQAQSVKQKTSNNTKSNEENSQVLNDDSGSQSDPFAAIRQRKHLRSKADIVLNNKNRE